MTADSIMVIIGNNSSCSSSGSIGRVRKSCYCLRTKCECCLLEVHMANTVQAVARRPGLCDGVECEGIVAFMLIHSFEGVNESQERIVGRGRKPNPS